MAGDKMKSEMSEQPDVLAGLLERRSAVTDALRTLLPKHLHGVLLVARGSSDNAALHARYLLETSTGCPAALAAPSLWTRYKVSTALQGWVAVAVSQSGQTPEILTTVERMRHAGAVVVSVTNGSESDLAAASDLVVDLQAGQELAVPATKSVTASLLALTHVARGLGRVPWDESAERRLPEDVATVLADRAAAEAALDVLGTRETVHIGRGYSLPVALEAALKIKETTLRPARGYASGDFLHGPVAALGPGSAVVGYSAAGPTVDDVAAVLSGAQSRAIPILAVTDAPTTMGHVEGMHVLPVPAGLPEPLVSILLVVRAQQLAHAAALRGGLDPDRPAGLSKVTITH